jgi:outer membrane murein-binding lipoprotein Lpp
MKTSIPLVFAAVASFALVGCSSKTGVKTYNYLREVGRVRQLYNTDAQESVVGVKTLQYVKLEEAANRTEQYKQTLLGTSSDGVDPEAVQFTQSVATFLDSVRSMYLNGVELIKAEQEARRRHFGPSPIAPLVSGALAAYENNVGGVVKALGELMDDAQKSNAARKQFLTPSIAKLRASRDQVVAARQALHEQAAKAKADFQKSYPDNDWTLQEVLPQ